MTSLKKIVLTRPVDQAQPLARRLTLLGYPVELFPLLEIAPLADQSESHIILRTTIAGLSRYAMAVFVSPNAIHAVFNDLPSDWPPHVAIAVMGEGSRAALAQYGINEKNTSIFCPADLFSSDSEALLQELDLPALKDREVVIFRAETGRELLSEALISHSISVTKVVSYRRFTPPITDQQSQVLQSLLTSSNDWVVNSSEALRALVDMVDKLSGEVVADAGVGGVVEDVVAKLQQINLLVPHRRIAETAEKCGFKHIRLIGSGDENLLLALQSHP